MKSLTLFTTSCILACLISFDALGQTTINLSSEKDNTIFQVPNRYSNGSGTEMYTGTVNNGTALARRALIQFSFSEIPVDALITDVQLVLYCTRASRSGTPSNYDLHRLEESWGEMSSQSFDGVGVIAEDDDATWKDRFYDASDAIEWLDQGGTFEPIPSASIPVNEKDAFYTWTSEELVEDVQDMLANPSENFGWILKASDENIGGLGRGFVSRENPVEERRPQLIVTYTTATSLSEFDNNNSFQFYPNPTSGVIYNKFMNDDIKMYSISDVTGKVLKQETSFSNKGRIDLSNLSNGIYFIRIETDNNTFTSKIIKE